MADFIYRAEVDADGKLAKIHNSRGFYSDLKLFSGQTIQISFKKFRRSRSTKQNAYYHSCLIPAVIDGLVDAGYERYKLNSETVHEFLKDKFLKEEITSQETGEIIAIPRSTASLSTIEFATYVDDIIRWSAEFLNITIPLPNEQSEMDL